jgi:hypothetical protein
MSHKGFTLQHRIIGRTTAWAVSGLEMLYAVTTVLGLLSLKNSHDPIGDPFFSMMELLIIFITPLMVISMVAVHGF